MSAGAPTHPSAPVPAGAAVVALSPGGLALARSLAGALPAAQVHARARLAGTDAADETFTDIAAHLRALFAAGTPIVALCAAGIVIRALAGLLSDKRAEPPVVAVAEDGSTAVPLIGGHRGANALARAVAAATGGTAAITTAGEVRLGVALDDPPPGWRVRNPEAAKGVAAALLAGEPAGLVLEAGDGGWLSGAGLDFRADARPLVRVTAHETAPAPDELVLHPPVLALGLGCERGAPAGEVLALARETLAAHGLSPQAVACVATIDIKADEPAMAAVAEALEAPLRPFGPQELEAERPRLRTPSAAVFRVTGCHGVAEGAALATAGPEGALIAPKVTKGRATCAVALAPQPIDAERAGRAHGRLAIVGLGPGAEAWLTPEAGAALAAASDVVGYGAYLDLIEGRIAGKTCHRFALGEEETRARRALDLAAEGRTVALVSSGDAGIYGLAALVFELIDHEDREAWRRIAVEVAPGVSALQAAAARAGAPLGHDFCAISLSDLLTPWAEIERRLEAAGAGDFVVALYNPASARRRTHLARAADILRRHRPGATPVILAHNLGRAGERVEVTALDALDPARVDMLTLVLVGSSRTRAVTRGGRGFVYTPRGYGVAEREKSSKPAAGAKRAARRAP